MLLDATPSIFNKEVLMLLDTTPFIFNKEQSAISRIVGTRKGRRLSSSRFSFVQRHRHHESCGMMLSCPSLTAVCMMYVRTSHDCTRLETATEDHSRLFDTWHG